VLFRSRLIRLPRGPDKEPLALLRRLVVPLSVCGGAPGQWLFVRASQGVGPAARSHFTSGAEALKSASSKSGSFSGDSFVTLTSRLTI